MGTSKRVKAQATLLPGPGSLCFQLHGPLAAPLRQQRRKWQPTPVLLPGKFHGLRSLVGYSPWGCKESDTTERLHFRFKTTASCISSCLQWSSPSLCLCRIVFFHKTGSWCMSSRTGGLYVNSQQRLHWPPTELIIPSAACPCACVCVSCFSCVQLFATPWTVTLQAPLSMQFSRQEYWSGSPFLSPWDLPEPGIKSGVSCLADRFLAIWATREALSTCIVLTKWHKDQWTCLSATRSIARGKRPCLHTDPRGWHSEGSKEAGVSYRSNYELWWNPLLQIPGPLMLITPHPGADCYLNISTPASRMLEGPPWSPSHRPSMSWAFICQTSEWLNELAWNCFLFHHDRLWSAMSVNIWPLLRRLWTCHLLLESPP